MEETKKETKKVEKKKLSPEATILITIAATLGVIVVGRAIYWIITGA